jgi:hypothetical protein
VYFEHEQDVEPAQDDCVEMKEIDGEQAGGLGAQEVAPVGVDPSGRWSDPGGGKDAPDGAFSDAVAEPDQLALKSAMAAPGGFLERGE